MEPGTLQLNSTRLRFSVLLTGSCTYIHVYTHIYTYIGGVRVRGSLRRAQGKLLGD